MPVRVNKKLAFPVILILLFLLGIPFLINHESIRSKLAASVSERLNMDIHLEAISINWVPLPHISITNLAVSHTHIKAMLPEIAVYPDWKDLLIGSIGVARISLNRPAFTIESFEGLMSEKAESAPEIPSIAVRHGSLKLPASGLLQRLVSDDDSIHISGITGRLDFRHEKIVFSLAAVPRFAKKIRTKGEISLSDFTYDLHLDCRDFNPHEFLRHYADLRPNIPVDSDMNFHTHLKGSGSRCLSAQIRAEMPCLILSPEGRKMLFSCGLADMTLEKDDNRYAVSINTLELTDPELAAVGTILCTDMKNRPLDWKIDIRATSVDIGSVRKKILAFCGNRKTVQKIFTIVQGGRAGSLHFTFNGSTPDFRSVEAMKIAGDVSRGVFNVPKIGLIFRETTGPVTIRDGILTAPEISAETGTSLISNGSLVIGLSGPEKVLEVDVELEADLSELHSFLKRTIGAEKVRKELELFSKVQGRAAANLKIRGTLNKQSVFVDISRVQGSAWYERINSLVTISDGSGFIGPDKAEWSSVSGHAGPHIVREFTGSVRWDRQICLKTDRFAGHIDSAVLFKQLKTFTLVGRRLKPVLDSIEGPLKIKGAYFKGCIDSPDNWTYGLDASADGIKFNSPELPGSISVKRGRFKLTRDALLLSRLDLDISNHRMNVSGKLQHGKLKHWRGHLKFTGTVDENISRWIKSKNWIPRRFYPAVPCMLDDLTVAWAEDYLNVTGSFARTKKGREKAAVQLDIISTPDRFDINRLAIAMGQENAVLSFSSSLDPVPGISLRWDGRLDGSTLDFIMENNQVLSGFIEGSCEFTCGTKGAHPVSAEGNIRISSLNCWCTEDPGAEIQILDLSATGSALEIEDLQFNLDNEVVNITGRMAFSDNETRLDLDLESEFISYEKITEFLRQFGMTSPRLIPPIESVTAGEARHHIQPCPFPAFTGEIDFRLDTFRFTGKSLNLASPTLEHQYEWQDMLGQIVFQPENAITLSIESGHICDLMTTGIWHSNEKSGPTVLSINTASEDGVEFGNFFSCMGIDQHSIEGAFSLAAELEGRIRNWRKGHFKLSSSSGRIMHMTLLSRVLSIVNMVDIFKPGSLKEFGKKGFRYSDLEIAGLVESNHLDIRRLVIKGSGINLFGQGTINIATREIDMVLLESPFKTVDAIISKVPIVGQPLVGEDNSMIAIPVSITGKITDPKVQVLSGRAAGTAIKNIVRDALSLPFKIIAPIFPSRNTTDDRIDIKPDIE